MAYSDRHEILSWSDVDKLIDLLVPQLIGFGPFDAMLLVTRGGVIPGGMIAEALDIKAILTASVDFPSMDRGLMAFPKFLQFPDADLLQDEKILVVDDVWGSGRTSTTVRERVEAQGGNPMTCVLHYNPYRSLFTETKPNFYAAVTDAYVVYPWEIDRGLRGWEFKTPSPEPQNN